MAGSKNREVGLGRGLSDLLEDNDKLPNMKNNVLLRREDGKSVKIHDKTGGEEKKSQKSVKITKR